MMTVGLYRTRAAEPADIRDFRGTRIAVSSRCMLTDLPNLLTLSRIAAIPLLVGLVAVRHPMTDLLACILFAAAAITDYFDGRLARSRRQQSDLGRMLDPIADKLLVGAVLMMLVGMGRVSGAGVYPAIVIMLREILVSGLREYLAGIRIGLPVTALAKWKTGFQMGALGTLLAGDTSARLLHLSFIPVSLIGEIMLWGAAVLTIVTGWDYLMAGLHHASTPRQAGPEDGAIGRRPPV
jgi:CDP-diacylglycerol---glycerol-3-phosphate 3-phosphatidyltransferase